MRLPQPALPPTGCHLTEAIPRARGALGRVLFGTLLLGAFTLAGCAGTPEAVPASATATPSPFPTFDLRELPPPPGGAPAPEVRDYLAAVAPYTIPAVIAVAPEYPAEQLDEIVATLEDLPVPAGLTAAHETLLKGYRNIAQGRRIQVENVGDGEQQAEARSLTDFGQLLLQEHIQIVTAYLASLQATPLP